MAVYDRTAQNSFTGFAEGDLESFGTNTTLLDISDRDGPLFNTSTEYLYGFDDVPPEVQEDNSNIQLAATGLIDNCFHYVFVFDGKHLMRYRLTNANLVWNGFMTEVPGAAFESELRSEMELIQLANGNYRLAVPYEPNGQDYGIAVYTLNPNGQIIGGSYLDIDEFGNDINGNTAEMYGLEFDPTGQYLYVTHETNLNLPNPLDVYDVVDDHFETIPSLSGISDYQNSFIEAASNGKLYLLSSDYMGELDNVSFPSILTFDDALESVSSDHLNDAQTSSSGQERYILPEQLDVNYPDLASMSCECCRTWTESVNSYTATTSDTWAPGSGNNPFNASSDVYIRDQLIIDPGVDITIDNMNFYFGPEAEVIVRREENSSTGAYLELTNGTVFTMDDRCPGQDFTSCGQSLDCDKERWQGIRVEGFENNTSQNWNSSTPHARLRIEDQSVVEFAEIGAQSGHSGVSDSGGGMIRLDNAIIKDCITGIKFLPYVKLSGSTEVYTRSFIRESKFKTTSDWFGSQIPNAFVHMIGSSGINLDANEFINEIPGSFDLIDRGLGIYSINSRVTNEWTCDTPQNPCPPQDIVKSTFDNLYYGIFAFNTSSSNRTMYDYHSEYTNNFVGVLLSDLINPEVLDGTFRIMPQVDATGIYLSATTGYIIENNVLSTYNGLSNNRNIGIYVSNSGIQNNQIYRNFFYNLTRGGVTVGLNADPNNQYVPGLDWKCNEFESPIDQADLYLDGSISEEQGLCTLSELPAGNLFSYSGSGHYDVYSTTGSFSPVDYNYHDNAGAAPVKPLTISSNNDPQDWVPALCSGIDYDKNTCSVQKSSLPVAAQGKYGEEDITLTEESISLMADDFINQIEELESNGLGDEGNIDPELYALEKQYDIFWQDVSRYYMKDTIGTVSEDQMISLVQEYQPRSIERFSSIICSVDNQNWIDTTNSSHIQDEEAMSLPIVDENGELPRSIPEYYESGYFESHGNVSALNELYVENDTYYYPFMIDSEIEGIAEENKSLGASNQEQKILVQPNPFSNQVLFDLSELNLEDQSARIEIYDLVGKRVLESVVPSGQTQIQIEGGNLPSGYLTFTIVVEGEVLETGKLLHLNK
jgi:hypothetical protein